MDEAKRLFRVRKTAIQMCHDRGFCVGQDELDETFEEFMTKFGGNSSEPIKRSELSLFVSNKSGEETLLVSFSEEEKIGTSTVKTILLQLQKEKCNRCILVSKGDLTAPAKQFINQETGDIRFEHFMDDELVINVTEHELVPQHIILNEEEKTSIFKKYMIKETQLPRMLVTDPVARYYGLEKGVLVKIIRNSDTGGRYVTYRLVC